MTLYESMRPGSRDLADAARVISDNSADGAMLEGIVRKVERVARHAMFRRFLADAANDTGDPPG